MPQGKTKEAADLKEEAMLSPEKTKFGRRGTKDAKSICNSDKETNSRIILIGIIPISLNCFTSSLTLLAFFKSKEMKKSLVEVKEKQPTVDEDRMYKGVTIEPSKVSRPQNVILEKPIVEMTKTHSMSNQQGSYTRGSSMRHTLSSISLPCWRCWASPKRIRPTLRPIMLRKLLYSMY